MMLLHAAPRGGGLFALFLVVLCLAHSLQALEDTRTRNAQLLRSRQARVQEKVQSMVAPAQAANSARVAAILQAIHNSNSNETANLFSLIPGRYPNAISLPDFLTALPSMPGGQYAIKLIAQLLQNKTGVDIPQSILEQILTNSSVLVNYFKFTPQMLHELFVGLNLVMPPDVPSTGISIPSGFKYPEDIASYPIDITPFIPTIGPLSPNSSIYFGFYFPNTTTRAQAKVNIITSLIFNQLSDNHHLKPTDPNWFVVAINGKNYSRVDDLLSALLDMGATMHTYLTKRIAAFYGIYVKDKNGNMKEVADPLMIQTGIFDSTGTKEATLAAIHSEYVIEFQLKNFNFNIVWYEGDDGTGFFPGNMYVLESWVGELNGPDIKGKDAVKALLYMSLLRDIVIQIAVKNKFFDGGYGISGVCDDSCGVIEIATGDVSTEYPNLMDKSFVVPEIYSRIVDKSEPSYMYYDLLKIVNGMAIDWRGPMDPSAKARAMGTIVWPPGKEPFQSTVEARAILSA